MAVPEHLWRFPTRAAMDAIAERFGLASDRAMQDWEWQVADATRIDELLAPLESTELSGDERFVLAEISLQSFEALAAPLAKDSRWARFLEVLDDNAALHAHSIWYWSCVDSDDADEWWSVTPFLRRILKKHRLELDPLPLELLSIQSMASGERSLRLTARVSWEDFPRYARALVSLLGGSIDDEADSPVERVWSVTIRAAPFWLCFDDFGLGASLDSRDDRASAVVEALREELRVYRSRRPLAG